MARPFSLGLFSSRRRRVGLVLGTILAVYAAQLAVTAANAADIVATASTQNGTGYWTTSSAGVVTANGSATKYGDMSGKALNKPVVGIAVTPSNLGYWLVASDGGVFTFGDAKFYGSTGSINLFKPMVGMASTSTGKGYWLVAADGGIFAYGDAVFYGSTGGKTLNKPVNGMAATITGKGYWLVASDGGIFTFGDAKFYGSTGSFNLVKPVVGMAPTTSGLGYWLVANDGGIFAFGDAQFYGRPNATTLGIVRTSTGYRVLLATGAPVDYPTQSTTTTTTPVSSGTWPSTPPAKICGNAAILTGPSTAPAGAIVVPAGDNSALTPNWVTPGFSNANKTFWFAPGVHTLGTGQYSQIGPGNNSTFLGAPGAIIDGQDLNNYAFSGHATGVTIKYLTVRNFTAPNDEGVVNHDAGDDWTIQYNTMTLNGGASVFGGNNSLITHNCMKDNGQYGFQVFESGTVLDHNEVSGNNQDNVEAGNPGCGCSGANKFWDAHNVKVTNNYIHDNDGPGIWADTNNSNFLIEGNWIENNAGQAIFYETSYNAAIRNNVLRHNLLTNGYDRIQSGDNFLDAAIYLSESGGDARVPYNLVGSPTIDISNNLIQDNYNGVSLWENADRYCGSPANTSTDYCTLVNPTVATLTSCNPTNIANAPYYSDCRWKTQNVKVHHNSFKMNPANFYNCDPDMCGRNGVFANYGTYPSWSPYMGDKVIKAINYSQGNVFSNNTYTGPWNFSADALGDAIITPTQWKAAPHNQDAGSTFTP